MHINQTMYDFVINLLKTRIPVTYYYHNYEHTLYVMEKVIEIGKQENCTASELKLLEVAALWHDTGYINSHSNHEEAGCLLARKYLPEYGFTAGEITEISGMIMATKIPQTPKTKLEEIIADADLEYLGTDKVAVLADHLFKELKALNPQLTEEAWNKTEIDFLTSHAFFTPYCKKNKEQIKQAYLKSLTQKKA
jgi:uncharacterized protein